MPFHGTGIEFGLVMVKSYTWFHPKGLHWKQICTKNLPLYETVLEMTPILL